MKLAVIAPTRLLPEFQQKVQALAGHPIDFPADAEQPTADELISRSYDAQVVLVSPGTALDAAYFDACPGVKHVVVCGTSLTSIDTELTSKRSIQISNVVDYGDEPTAEYVFMRLTRLLRGEGEYMWDDKPHELKSKAIGIVGAGAVGKAIIQLAEAYKMNISYFGPHRKPEPENVGVQYKELTELLSTSDIVALCGPGNTKVLEASDFQATKPKTILVQVSSGSVFERNDFLAWVAKPGNFAMFDMSAGQENYKAYHKLNRVIFSEVIAGDTHETLERLGQKVVEILEQL